MTRDWLDRKRGLLWKHEELTEDAVLKEPDTISCTSDKGDLRWSQRLSDRHCLSYYFDCATA